MALLSLGEAPVSWLCLKGLLVPGGGLGWGRGGTQTLNPSSFLCDPVSMGVISDLEPALSPCSPLQLSLLIQNKGSGQLVS